MTRQIKDRIKYDGETYTIFSHCGHIPFYPEKYDIILGLRRSSACYRGWMARYLVDAERFYLDALYFNKEIISPVEAQRRSIEELYYSRGLPREGCPLPTEVLKLNGVEAVDNNDIPYLFKQCYKNVKLPIGFSGGLLIVGDIAPDVSRGGMVDCFWEYGQTYELTFENGRLYEAADKSDVAAMIREKRLETHLYPFKSDAISQEVKAKVLSLFSMKYSFVY